MPENISVLEEAVEQGEEENGSIEFKKHLKEDIHLKEGKRESLTAQLRHRVLSGDGTATYAVGVTDDGEINGIPSEDFTETLDVLSLIAQEADARINDVETWNIEGGNIVGLVEIKDGNLMQVDENHIVIGTAGHVDHGKSTLIGSLITGETDDGAGEMRKYLDTRPHEEERGLSATLSHAVYGFKDGKPLHLNDPRRNNEQASIVEESDKVISFVDTVGHSPWLRTTIRGIVGQRLDYGLLTVAADDGPTKKTREHLGILLATELPTIVAITKADIVDDKEVELLQRTLERYLRDVGKTPLRVETHGAAQAVKEISENVVPIVVTSSVTGQGLDTLNEIFAELPKNTTEENTEDDFKMYVDRLYEVTGVGAVVSGAIKSGVVEAGDELYIGPFNDGSFREVEARSIEFHHYRVDKAKSGQIVGINLTNVSAEELRQNDVRGMVLLDKNIDPEPVSSFKAELMVLNHPTSIKDGYEPVIHLETLSETVKIYPSTNNLLPGDTGLATIDLKFNPAFIEEGQKFVFREGQAKGVGTVIDTNTEE